MRESAYNDTHHSEEEYLRSPEESQDRVVGMGKLLHDGYVWIIDQNDLYTSDEVGDINREEQSPAQKHKGYDWD